jgi:putative colanic acid biosynthesis acetyltransferase WcaB
MKSSADELANFAVVVPAYNAAGSLERTVRSAYTAGANRIIVVDDGSTDETFEIASRLDCTVIRQANSGAAAARRAGIALIHEDFAVLLDADDSLLPEGVHASIRLLLNDPTAAAAQGRTVGVGTHGARKVLRHWDDGVDVSGLLERGHAPGPPAAFVWNTSALRRVISEEPQGLWPRYAEDYEFILRGALIGPVLTHDALSCVYQWTGGKSGADPRQSILDADKIRLHYARLVGAGIRARTSREIRSMVHLRKASALTSRRNQLRRLGHMAQAAITNPVGLRVKLARRLRRNNANEVTGSRRIVSWADLAGTIRRDFEANPRDPKARLVLLSFRVTQAAMKDLDHPRVISLPFVIVYRLMTEFGLGIELRPKTSVGAGLTIFHGVGLVVNDHAVIGSRVTLRNGVTIGHRHAGGGSPVIEDDVNIGVSALVIGAITIGRGAAIGAGAVVLKDVAAFTSVGGNPAKKLSDLTRPSQLEDDDHPTHLVD